MQKLRSVKTNAILNMIKQCCAIVFPLITLPYVTRVIGTEGLGKYSFSSSIVNYFVLIAALGINTYAIREGAPIRDNRTRLEQFGNQVFSINLCSSAFAYVLLAILLCISERIRLYWPFILIQSFAIILSTIGAEWVNSIYEDYLYITIRYVVIQFICLVFTFLLVRNTDDIILYTVIVVFAANGGYLINVFYRKKYCKLRFTTNMEIRKHLPSLLALFVNAIAILIYVNADITMLGFYLDDATVGIYSFAARIYNMVKGMIAAAITVALPRMAYIRNKENSNYQEYIRKMFSMLTMISAPIIIGLVALSRPIIYLIGGEEFLPSKSVLVVLAFAILFALYTSIVTNCILIVNKNEKKCMYSTLATAAVNIILNIFLIPYYGIIAAAVTTIIAELMNMIIQLYFASQYCDFHRIIDKNWIGYMIGTIITGCICVVVKKIIPDYSIINCIAIILISMVVSIFIYGFLLKSLDNEDYLEVYNMIKRRFK